MKNPKKTDPTSTPSSKAKLAFEMLEKEMSVINSQEILRAYRGGSTGYQEVTNDCVIKVFDYLDGPVDNYNMYWDSMDTNLGYTPDSTGGVKREDFETVGSYGGLNVTDLGASTGISASSGLSPNGNPIMMTFNGANGLDHAVVVTGVNNDVNSEKYGYISYYDPTDDSTGSQAPGQWNGFYEVEN